MVFGVVPVTVLKLVMARILLNLGVCYAMDKSCEKNVIYSLYFLGSEGKALKS